MELEYDFQILSDKLMSLGAICSVSELHGLYSGLIAGGKSWDEAAWLDHAREFADLNHFERTVGQKKVLLYVCEGVREAMNGDDFSFEPLLPDDVCPLEDRARELGAWCRGFLHGFGASGVTADTQLSPDVAEVLRDIAQISSAVKSVEDEEDETDADLIELTEYLRAGVMTIYNEMNEDNTQQTATNNAKPSLH